MRNRKVGGYEPDDREQAELVELWHLSLTALASSGNVARDNRLQWVCDTFMKTHKGEPHVAYKWIHVWAVDNLGLITARTVTVKDAWGHSHVVGGFGDVGGPEKQGK